MTLDMDKYLDDFDRRLHRVEQIATSPEVMGAGEENPNPSFETITVGVPGNQVTLSSSPPGAATNVSVSTGSHYDLIFADVTWSAPTSGVFVDHYEVEIARKVGNARQLERTAVTAGTSMRVEPLEPDTSYEFRITPFSRLGVPGVATDWLAATTSRDQSAPPAVSAASITVVRGATTVVVKFTPLTIEQAPDVGNNKGWYEIQIDTVPTFDSASLRTLRSAASVVSFSDVTEVGSWHARVAPIDSSGNQGPWAATTTAVSAGGVVDEMIVSGLSAAKITFGTMSGDRIQANSMDVAALKTSTLLAKDITIGAGGQFIVGDPPNTGLVMNSQGLRLYKNGSLAIVLDSVTGDASFSGSISGAEIVGSVFRTATTGRRLEINAVANQIDFYSGAELEASRGIIWSDTTTVGVALVRPRMTLKAPFGGNDPLDAPFIEFQQTAYDKVSGVPSTNVLYRGSMKLQFATKVFVALRKDSATSGTTVGAIQFYCPDQEVWATCSMFMVTMENASGTREQLFSVIPSGTDVALRSHKPWPTTTSAANVHLGVTNPYTLMKSTSSIEFKTNVVDLDDPEDRFSRLRPVRFQSICEADDPNRWMAGLIAEEVFAVDPDLANSDEHGKTSGVDYQQISALTLWKVQQLDKRVKALEAARLLI